MYIIYIYIYIVQRTNYILINSNAGRYFMYTALDQYWSRFRFANRLQNRFLGLELRDRRILCPTLAADLLLDYRLFQTRDAFRHAMLHSY